MTRLLARWIFPVDQPPIERGVVEIVDGIISAVEPLVGQSDSKTVDPGNVAIIPGLVNAHAHLEFSSLDSPIEPALPFTDWIGRLLAHRRERPGSIQEYTTAGIDEATKTGSSLVGDIVTGDWSPECLPGNGAAVVAFRELIGLLPNQVAPQLELARQHISDCRNAAREGQGGLAPAISPHAPYSVCPELFHQLVDLARVEDVPLCIHLAETLAELELLKSGTGEFFEMLSRFDLWRDGTIPKGTRAMDYLQPLSDLPHALIAHGNYLADDEISFLATHPNIATVVCPRTHAFFGHRNHPWERLLDAGASVCIGTDGRSSNPDYSLWSELQFLARTSGVARAPQILDAGTRQGAHALGQENATGTITVGKRADLTVISLEESCTTDPWAAIFAQSAKPVATITKGLATHAAASSSETCNADREFRTMLQDRLS
jgi:aminodeoxyfutalosine deaminase